jgi:hypothetical protein
MTATVLLLTHRHDHYTVDRVAASLHRRGAKALRLDTDRFPLEWSLDLRFDAQRSEARCWIGEECLESGDITAVWLRHLGAPGAGEAVDPAYRAFSATESRLVLEGWLDALRHARWMNPLAACLAGELKARQLRVALEQGLRVPATLATNRPEAVAPFFDAQNGALITKLQAPLSMSMDGRSPAFYTTALRSEDLEDLSGLRLCPQVFQERISKAAELRVIYVDGRCFTGSVRPNAAMAVKDDWRPAQGLRWEEDALPAEVERRFDAFMRAMGLNFGAADFIRTPEGEHVFLEINPCGEWGMLERDLDLPISEAIAEALLVPASAPQEVTP